MTLAAAVGRKWEACQNCGFVGLVPIGDEDWKCPRCGCRVETWEGKERRKIAAGGG